MLLIVAFFLNWNVFASLLSDMWDVFVKYYNWYSEAYLKEPYKTEFSKDPFKDTLESLENLTMYQRSAWIENIERELTKKNCPISKNNIIAILFYFFPEFRQDVVRSLKASSWKFWNSNYVLSKDEIQWYCLDYYRRTKVRPVTSTAKQKINEFKEGNWSSSDAAEYISSMTISPTSQDVMDYCKTEFKRMYDEWESQAALKQNVESSQRWVDKYWNSSNDDSPYDIMLDFETVGQLFFKQVERADQPKLYSLPSFNDNSQGSSEDQTSSQWYYSTTEIKYVGDWWNSGWWDNWWWNDGWKKTGNIWWNASTTPTKSNISANNWWNNNWWNNGWWDDSLLWEDEDWVADDLLSLWSLRNDSLFHGRLCSDDEDPEDIENISKEEQSQDVEQWDNTKSWWGGEVSDESVWWSNSESQGNEEQPEEQTKSWDPKVYSDCGATTFDSVYGGVYNVNAMKHSSSIDMTATNGKCKATIICNDGNLIRSTEDCWSEPEQPKDEEQVKDCVQSCKWLRWDKYISCIEMCACWEWDSSELGLFDPEKNPWLWPIVSIRLCTVPWEGVPISAWWKKVVSIEEWVEQIYWVVDKLEREWKLWIRTQQNNFLDSSTKKMKLVDMFAFTLDVEWVDIVKGEWKNSAKGEWKESEQFGEKTSEIENKNREIIYNIANSTDDSELKNTYNLLWGPGFEYMIDAYELREQAKIMRSENVDNISAGHNIELMSSIDGWIDVQSDFWVSLSDTISAMRSYAKQLYSKK